MSTKLMRLPSLAVVLVFASGAGAGMVEVELIPDNPGPYYGGESRTVDVWLHSLVDYDVRLRLLQFDFAASDPRLRARIKR